MEKNLNFDDAMSKMESILDELENNSETLSPEEVEVKIKEAETLKEHCKQLLKEEKEDIIKTAKENNISLEELGIIEGEEDYDNLDDDDDNEEEDEDGTVTVNI